MIRSCMKKWIFGLRINLSSHPPFASIMWRPAQPSVFRKFCLFLHFLWSQPPPGRPEEGWQWSHCSLGQSNALTFVRPSVCSFIRCWSQLIRIQLEGRFWAPSSLCSHQFFCIYSSFVSPDISISRKFVNSKETNFNNWKVIILPVQGEQDEHETEQKTRNTKSDSTSRFKFKFWDYMIGCRGWAMVWCSGGGSWALWLVDWQSEGWCQIKS